jgi:putative salt-induced outer membrane protein YdiY
MTYKKISLSLILSTAIITSTAIAHAATDDNLYMKNGDRLSGTIQSYTADTVTIDTVFGVLTVPVGNIGGVASPRYTATDLLGGDASQGMAANAPAPITIPEPADINPSMPIETASVDGLDGDDTPVATGLWGATWSGDTNAALQIEDGNSDSQNYAIDASITAEWDDNDRLKLSAEYENEKEDDETVTDERFAEILYDEFFAEQWFWQNSLRLDQDDIDDLNLRVNYLSGLGYRAIDTDTTRLQFVLGPGYLREDYEDVDIESALTAHWSTEYEQKFYDDLFRFYHDHNLTAPTDAFDAYLFESNTGVTIPIRAGVKVSGEIEFDWDNDPAAGNVEDDTTYNVKLGYEW